MIDSGDLRTDESSNICAASEMVAMGVFSSCVMLLTKSVFISVSFFCLKASITVYRNTTNSIADNASDGMMNRTELNM